MIYLHHYPASLFSEKIRALLGYYQLPWSSVEIPSIMPRPLLMPLSGGYRRTPVLQMGANVYSDTKVIAVGLARQAGDDGLFGHGFAAHRTADWADSQLFRVMVTLNFRPEALVAMMGQFTPEEAQAFAEDRAKLTGDQPMVSISPTAALAWLDHTLSELEQSLSRGSTYLFGESPCIADFAVYHNLWFLKNNPVNAPLLAPWQAIGGWLENMGGLAAGSEVSEADGAAALAHALSSQPSDPGLSGAPNCMFENGQVVSVTPTDYGCIPVSGELVGVDQAEVIIKRETPETGVVFNHFPQAGFEIATA